MTTTHDSATHAPRLPGLEPVRTGARTALSAAVARRLFTAAMDRLPVTVELAPGGRPARTLGTGGPRMTVHRPDELWARVGRDGLIGFGEAYLTGAWDAEDLATFLTAPAAEVAGLVPARLQRLRTLATRRRPATDHGTEDNTRANVAHHYDLSNELFALFLDPTLSYSSALFDTPLVPTTDQHGPLLAATPPAAATGPGAAGPDGTLEEAQVRKVERLLDQAGVGPGDRVLEIGTGWGELAIRAAARGATVRSITLSSEQQALARERVAAAGLSDQVSVDLCDYRELDDPTTYDAVLSVEMVEAVGHDFWPVYFRTVDAALRPGGRAAIQTIVMPHDRMLASRHTHTWITKYVFPGGLLPSVQAVRDVTATTALRLEGRLSMGRHYAETLRQWDECFLGHRDRLPAMGFDDQFVRMWHFYLAWSLAGFAADYIDVQQLTFVKEPT